MLVRGLARAMPECDRSVMAQPRVRASLMDSYQRAFDQGTRGQVHDWGVIAAPWGFRPQQITIEVHLWQATGMTVSLRTTPSTWRTRYPAVVSPSCAEKAT
jgi:hypothetical protein